jgi:short chain dehydrogenase
MDINVKGVWLSLKHEIPAMLQTGGGAIVNNASIGGVVGFATAPVYVAREPDYQPARSGDPATDVPCCQAQCLGCCDDRRPRDVLPLSTGGHTRHRLAWRA